MESAVILVNVETFQILVGFSCDQNSQQTLKIFVVLFVCFFKNLNQDKSCSFSSNLGILCNISVKYQK